ncbi:MAG: hypothetical protein ACO2PO_04015, partial [Candidatus Calescibacterium sp.]
MSDEKEKMDKKEKLPENQKKKRKKGVGVIGLGVSGKNLVSALIELGYTPVAFEKKSKEEFL